MKKYVFIFSLILILAAENATALRCFEGAVFDVDEKGQAQLVDCGKWEKNPEAVLAEQDAINAYTSEEVEFSDADIQYTKPDKTPILGKVQDRINDTWHNVYKSIFN